MIEESEESSEVEQYDSQIIEKDDEIVDDILFNNSIVSKKNKDNLSLEYIKKGPQVLDMFTQRTVCSIMLYFDHETCQDPSKIESSEWLRLLRGNKDKFPYRINVSELPQVSIPN